jgi:hypothetical protein
MTKRTTLILAASVLLGLVLGLAIRRARMPAPLRAVDARAQLPSTERISTALLRAEIRDLNARLAALREDGESLSTEKQRLQSLSQPPPPPSPESLVRTLLRTFLAERRITIQRTVLDWLQKNPANFVAMIKIAAEVFREKDWGKLAYDGLQQFLQYYVSNLDGDAQMKVLELITGAQHKEPDLLKRGLMLEILEMYQSKLPAEQLAELARLFREGKEPHFREAAFPFLLQDAAGNADLIREAVRQGDAGERTSHLLKAWNKRALPGGELRNLARELMKSDDPGPMIREAQDWVPKFINPLAPQETIALFDQTLSKPIEPIYKAVSMMVMGSVATLFPAQPGRAELDRFVGATDDPKLKEFAAKVISLIDEGKGYAEIRKLNPTQFGIERPK